MPNTTTNYNLTKPLETERYDVEVFNDNADIIDTQMKANADNIGTNTSDISSLASRVTTNEGNIGQITTRVTNLESLNAWTTVEFDLDDFTYDEDSGVTYYRIDAPSGYELSEVRGYFVLNKSEAGDASYSTVIDIAPANNLGMIGHILAVSISDSVLGYATIFHGSVSSELKYINSQNTYVTSSSFNINWSNSPDLRFSSSRGRSIDNTFSDLTGINFKTLIPNSNISEFYGKLQYRMVPSS